MFKILTRDGKARLGRLEVKGKVVESPFFMPVATKGVGKFVSSDDYVNVKTKVIISNAFLCNCVNIKEDLHKFMGYDGVIFTDNGGFQMIRENLFLEAKENGVFFNNLKGEKVWISPRRSLEFQWLIGSDVTMAMDYLLPYGKNKEEFVNALERSHEWTKTCKELHEFHKKDCLIFGITQGGTFLDLREKSAKFISSLGFDGYSLGGLGIGESDKEMFDVVKVSLDNLEDEKPKYLMGVGDVKQILECVSMGVDIFDSILPAKHARHGHLFTFNGIINIGKDKFLNDDSCVEDGCDCETCKRYSRKYLRFLFKKEDPVFKRLATVHNLRFMSRFMEKIRESIKEEKFEEFKIRMLKVYS